MRLSSSPAQNKFGERGQHSTATLHPSSGGGHVDADADRSCHRRPRHHHRATRPGRWGRHPGLRPADRPRLQRLSHALPGADGHRSGVQAQRVRVSPQRFAAGDQPRRTAEPAAQSRAANFDHAAGIVHLDAEGPAQRAERHDSVPRSIERLRGRGGDPPRGRLPPGHLRPPKRPVGHRQRRLPVCRPHDRLQEAHDVRLQPQQQPDRAGPVELHARLGIPVWQLGGGAGPDGRGGDRRRARPARRRPRRPRR